MNRIDQRLADIGKFESMIEILARQVDMMQEEAHSVRQRMKSDMKRPASDVQVGVLKLQLVEIKRLEEDSWDSMQILIDEQNKIIEEV